MYIYARSWPFWKIEAFCSKHGQTDGQNHLLNVTCKCMQRVITSCRENGEHVLSLMKLHAQLCDLLWAEHPTHLVALLDSGIRMGLSYFWRPIVRMRRVAVLIFIPDSKATQFQPFCMVCQPTVSSFGSCTDYNLHACVFCTVLCTQAIPMHVYAYLNLAQCMWYVQ